MPWSARRTRRRSSKLGAGDDSRDTARGAYARLAGLFGYALRIAHAACTRDHVGHGRVTKIQVSCTDYGTVLQ